MKTISFLWRFTCAQPNLWVLVNTLVMNLLMHFEEFFELVMCMVSLDKRPMKSQSRSCIRSFSKIILCMMIHSYHDITHLIFTSYNLARWRTISEQAWSIPSAHSTSFLQLFLLLCKERSFVTLRDWTLSSKMSPTKDRYYWPGNTIVVLVIDIKVAL
jgi:hypothetical protein